jgi:hypothetical protein
MLDCDLKEPILGDPNRSSPRLSCHPLQWRGVGNRTGCFANDCKSEGSLGQRITAPGRLGPKSLRMITAHYHTQASLNNRSVI